MLDSNLDIIWKSGYEKIMADEDAAKWQKAWVKLASEKYRELPAEELVKREFIYIPNDEYVLKFFGAETLQYKYGIYREATCNYYQRLMFPIWGFNSYVAGLGGWANDSQWKYIYSPDTLWDKRKYFYIHPNDMKKALEDDYIIIVDGIFDSINLNRIGLHSASLMGSNFSNWHRQYLRFFKYVIVIPDNDNAGVSLVNKIRKYRPDSIVLWQGEFKDIDDYIKRVGADRLIEQCSNLTRLQALKTIKLVKETRQYESRRSKRINE